MGLQFQNTNDEPPRVVAYPITMSSHQRYTTLTSGSFEVQDQDTDPADITIKVIKGPQNGIQSNTFLVILEEFLEDSSGFSN